VAVESATEAVRVPNDWISKLASASGLVLIVALAAAPTIAIATPTPAGTRPHDPSVRCGDVITVDTILDTDLGPCPEGGLILGARTASP
jgi:hypothetical protein